MAKIHVNFQGIQVLSKTEIIPEDTAREGSIDACRHANGKDWWVFKSGYRRNAFSMSILSPAGMSFERYNSTAPQTFESEVVWNIFSSNGTRFFHYMSGDSRILDVYDFGRCTIDLSNLQSYDFTDWVLEDLDFNPN